MERLVATMLPAPLATKKSLIPPFAPPKHIAIIMDGNGRWARNRNFKRIRGHWEGGLRVDEITTECAKLGVSYLTLYTFSTENWARPEAEVSGLFHIFVHYLRTMEKKLIRNKIALVAQGNLEKLPKLAQLELRRVRRATAFAQPRMYLNLALSYGGRDEIVRSVQKIANQVKNNTLEPHAITEETVRSNLFLPDVPDPDLLIRTGGEFRLSNFLLWQSAYTELYITETLWPEFRPNKLHHALMEFNSRQRRFGKTSAQVEHNSNEAPV